jgi:hypothetical protein
MMPLTEQPKGLLTCPFCGAAPKAFVEAGPRTRYMIECRGACQVHPSVFGHDIELISKDWNRRFPATVSPSQT